MGLTLKLSEIHKSYNGQPVLQGCSYTFARGDAYVIMGPNGSGKSTLLRIAALLEMPDQGQVTFLAGATPLSHDMALKRRLTMVFPRVGVFNTTVFQNIAYGLRLRGVARAERGDRVNTVLALVGLSHKAQQRALTLSSGETMRLGLARALVIEPDVLFLDEPTTSIDAANTAMIEQVILSLSRARNLTVIMVTHDAAQARRFPARLLLLQAGRLVEQP